MHDEVDRARDCCMPIFARRLIENMETDKAHLNAQYFVDKAIDKACFVLERIDKKFPVI